MQPSVVGPRDGAGKTGSSGPSGQGVAPAPRTPGGLMGYTLLGMVFGIALLQSGAASWFRIQEMLRFQSPHLFLVLGSAVATAAVGLRWIRARGMVALNGERVCLPPKARGSGIRYLAGGTVFGLGWALTGTCPGPAYALLGAGVGPVLVPLASALVGTWVYGRVREGLPH